jgi:hypothetical protein
MLDCGMGDERTAGGRIGDKEGKTVGGTTDLLLCDPCDAAAGKDGESTIIENGNVDDGFPMTKPADDEAGADIGCRSYTRDAIGIAREASNFGDDRRSCDTGVMEGDSAS